MELLWHYSLEIIAQFLKLSTFFAIVVLPATWVSLRRISGLSVAARLGIGVSAGFALFVVGAWYIGLWSFDYLPAFWLAQLVVAIWLGRNAVEREPDSSVLHRVSGGRERAGAKAEPEPAGASGRATAHAGRRRSWPVLLPLLAGVLLQLYALQFSILPHGVDASFHCVVGQRLLDARHVTSDLWPLEAITLNYPIGSHLWLVVAARSTGLEVHEVFRHSFAIALCAAGLVVAAWAERTYGTPFHGAAAAVAFVFCSFQASLFPYSWGGLPSLFAMWLGLAALFCVTHSAHWGWFLVSVLLFASTAMVHHHTMIALLGGAGLVAVVLWMMSPSSRPACRRILLALVIAAAVAGIYVIPLATRVSQLSEVGVLRYTEPFGFPWQQLWNWEVEPFAQGFTLISAVLTVVAVGLGLWMRPRPEQSGIRILFGLAAVWLLSFAVLDYGGRLMVLCLGGSAYQPFTPSRFLFDAQFAMAIVAGGGLVRLWDYLVRPAFRYAAISLLACGAICQVEPRWQAKPDDVLVPMGHWIDRNLPADALITGSHSVWVTYTAHRESTSLFIPVSERADPTRHRLKTTLLNSPRAIPWPAWRQALGKPIYLLGYADDENVEFPPIVVAGPYAVYDVNR